jgi:2-oxoglutarate ferredoxin oxidoreductase subunit beta
MTDRDMHYCSGCMHGVVHRLVAEVLDELDVRGKTVGISPVGCSVFAYNYFNTDGLQAPHGRACAVATGVKRVNPDNIVFTYQGDGDLAAIGTAETIHAAARGENITVVFINNAIYGMTSGQMAPTTLVGQVTSTSPYGRKSEIQGLPIKVCEMLSTIAGVAYAERVSTDSIKNIRAAKKALTKAFQYQIDKKGFTLIEVLSNCPTYWGMSPVDSLEWMRTDLMPYYPLGVYKDIEAKKEGV